MPKNGTYSATLIIAMANLDLESELKAGIAYFEQILDVLPGDRSALEFLCVACQQIGDEAKSLKYSIALAEIILRDKDVESANDLIQKLQLSEDSRAKATVLKLQVLLGPKPELKFERPELQVTSSTPSVAAKAELALLKKLISDGVLTESLVQTAIDQLETPPPNSAEILISALYILEKENLTGAIDAVAAVADAAHAPPVPLDAFEIIPANVRRLPAKMVKVRGVVPFAKLGNEWAVALLNPLDAELKREVSASMGAKCHFFLASPSTIEKVLDRVFKSENDTAPEFEQSPVQTSALSTTNPISSPQPEPISEPAAVVAPEPPVAPVALEPPKSRPKLGIRRPSK